MKWIAVEDRTPPHQTDVLLGWFEEWPERKFKQEVGWFSQGKRTEVTPLQVVSNYSQHGRATHWMPLPAPPKGHTDD